MKETELQQFFNERVKDLEKQPNCVSRTIADSLICLKFTDSHFHFLLPAQESPKKFIEELASLEQLSLEKKEAPKEQKPIIFRNRQAVGDILMMTAGVRDFKREFPDWPVNVSTTASHIWDNNPYLDRSLTKDNSTIVDIGPGALTNASNRDDRHFANAFRISMEKELGVNIPQGPIKPDIWMTEEEIRAPIIEPPYWIIVAGEKGDWTAKTFPFRRWQEFVENFPDVKFVQIGALEHRHPSLEMKNVINYIGKTQSRDTGIRDLFRLFYFAEGSLGLVSFQMHLAAAFEMPCVVIAGAREPARFTRYPGHQYLCTDGCLPCSKTTACWHCDLEKTCPSVITDPVSGQRYPKCVDIIKTEDVIRAFNQYYEGGRLSFSSPRTPSLPNGVVHSSDSTRVFTMIKKEIDAEKIARARLEEEERESKKKFITPPSTWGFNWGGSMITDKDWSFIKSVIDKNNVRTVLEFGSGLSTALFETCNLEKVVSYETNDDWISTLKKKGVGEKVSIRKWNGTIVQDSLSEFDLAFVDGPSGGKTREFSTKFAAEHARLVIVHDANREWERKWQEKFLVEKFDGPKKGGHRCHLWEKKAAREELAVKEFPLLELPSDKKVFRLLFNGRGQGGAERSTNWIMTQLINRGWDVEYVHPGPTPSGTFREEGHPAVKTFSGLEALRRPCDVLLLYTNDWVWEFNKDPVISGLELAQAKRKVMAVNFRLGDIGKVKWTQDWNKYLFLNKSLELAFLTQYSIAKGESMYILHSRTLPPPTDLTKFLETNIDYSGNMRIVRHSSQGDGKYAKNFNEKVASILEAFPDATIRLMPAPSFLEDFGERVISHKRNQPSVKEFLALGNVFWYDLPDGYHDMGPKVVMEAQASGLPIIAVNHSGPKDRVVSGSGFLYDDFSSCQEMFAELNDESMRRKLGTLGKEHAIKEYRPELWIDEILGEKDEK